MISPLVKVPVLSVHRTSIAPKFSIASLLFTSVSFFANDFAPLLRLTLTIIGNIDGVIPTATDTAKKNASKIL